MSNAASPQTRCRASSPLRGADKNAPRCRLGCSQPGIGFFSQKLERTIVFLAVALLATPIIPAGIGFKCTPVAVYDGDGPIWCAEGPKIRLAGIAAREMNETCNSNQPCPRASAVQARNQLVSFLGGPKGVLPTKHVRVAALPMRCLSEGNARGSRTAAWCKLANGVDLNCAMVRSGTTLRWDRYWRSHRCS